MKRFFTTTLLGFALLLLAAPASTVVYAADPAPVATTPTAADSADVSGVNFSPLTQLPGIRDAATSGGFADFLNQVYKILIGVGTVLAFFMICYAGFEIMTSRGSVSSNEKAKSRLFNAILGLVLLLSPVVVFSVINPEILNLKLDFSELASIKELTSSSGGADAFDAKKGAFWVTEGNSSVIDAARCAENKGTIQYGCKKKTSSEYRKTSSGNQCTSEETSYNSCFPTSGNTLPTTKQACTDAYLTFTSISTNGDKSCNTSGGFVAVPSGCCDSGVVGALCCGKPKGQYLLAYTYKQTPKAGITDVKTCVNQPAPKYYATPAACNADLDTFKANSGSLNATFSNFTVLKSCTLTTDTTYKMPVDPNAC